MSSALFQYASITCWAVAAGALAWYALSIAGNVTYVTLADGRRQERRVPLLFRLLLPFTANFSGLFSKPTFVAVRAKVDASLVTAGLDGLLTGGEFLALKILLPLCVGPFWVLLIVLLGTLSPALSSLVVPLSTLGILWLYVWPMTWLRALVKARQAAILRALPFVLDLVTLSVEAGLDFMTALQRSTERAKLDPLSEELLRVVRETQLGASRRDALRAMANRVDVPDLRSVVNALVQADELGVSVGAILRIQGEQVRQRRFERAERLANEAPTKLLAPLMIFIFPSVFLILMGPVVYQMINHV